MEGNEVRARLIVWRCSVVYHALLENGRWIVATLQPPALREGQVVLEHVVETTGE
jgi:hypothetical protein